MVHSTSFLVIFVVLLLLSNISSWSSGELVVNVKNQGGEIYQEIINANITDETIQLEFHQTDGTIVTQFMDFKNEIQIINTLILGDEELQREQVQYQILCFVTRFYKTEFVPPDAMAKLRQKNPWAVRTPERELAKDNVTLDVLLDIRSTDWISPYIKTICADAQQTYSRREDLEIIVLLKSNGSSVQEQQPVDNRLLDSVEKLHEQFLRAVKPTFPGSELCHGGNAAAATGANLETAEKERPCLCHLDHCVGWYPCALKYCRGGSTSSHEAKSYRCGIHTCKKCSRFFFSVPRRYSCII